MYILIDSSGKVRDTATSWLEAKVKQSEWEFLYKVTLEIKQP